MSHPSNSPEPEAPEDCGAESAVSALFDALARRNRVVIDDSAQWVYAFNGQPMGIRPSAD